MALSVEWYRNCKNDEDRRKRKSVVLGASDTLEVLQELTEARKAELSVAREPDYNNSAWAYWQAHRNGRLEELDRLLQLLRSVTTHE